MKLNIHIILISLFISGCSTFSGNHLSTYNKSVEKTAEIDINDYVTIYPLNVANVAAFKQTSSRTQTNPFLEQERESYIYHIGSGDVLNIVVYDHPELTTPAGAYRSAEDSGNWVNQDGHIYYPYIGAVEVAGKTVIEVREDITERLKKYIEKPQVTVSIAAFRSQRVYITGEVNHSGIQHLSNIPMTLLDAVNKSGGLDEQADWRHVALTRNGSTEVLSLHALMQQGDLSQNRLLQAGDIIHVPRNDDLKVFVMGEVKENKLLKMDRSGMSLTEALSQAGGLDQMAADATGVFVIRSHHTSNKADSLKAHIYQLDVSDATSLIVGTEFELQPYDLVYVTAAPITRWNRVIEQLLPTIQGVSSVVDTRNKLHKL